MIKDYDARGQAIAAAGFFTNGVENHGTLHRTCVCSKRRADRGLTGNSFWVSPDDGAWYLGAWGATSTAYPTIPAWARLAARNRFWVALHRCMIESH